MKKRDLLDRAIKTLTENPIFKMFEINFWKNKQQFKLIKKFHKLRLMLGLLNLNQKVLILNGKINFTC